MRVRGRDAELGAIGELVSATLRGAGGVLLVEGPPGIGKTRLLADALAIATRAGLRRVSAEAFDGQRTVPFSTLLCALLEARLWSPERLERLRESPELVFWLVEELHEALEAAALEGPLLIALDDLQAADAGTLLALRTLVPRTAGLPILWVLSLRTGGARVELRELTARLGDARRLVLRALSDEAVAEVVADRLQAAGDPALLELAANARGNPFLLVELLEGLREEGRVQVVDGLARVRGDDLPRRLAESMRERLDRLSADACRLVRVAAVLGHRFTEVAGVLLELGADAVQVAANLAESAEPGDAVAIEQLRRAARSLATTDVGAAADMSVRALELTPPEHPERTALVAETMGALHAALRDDEAAALGASALDGVLSHEEEAEVRLSLSSRLTGRDLLSAEENRRALRLPGISPRLRAQHLGWLACTLANSGVVAEAEEVTVRALAAAHEAGDESACAMATVGQITCLLHRGRYTAALEAVGELDRLAARAGDHVAARMAEFQRAVALAALGQVDAALRLLRDGLERGRRERSAWLVSGWVSLGAHLRIGAGALADAAADAEAAEAMGFSLASHVGGAAALLARFRVALHTDDRAQLRASVATARRIHAEVSPAVRRHTAWMLALAAMQGGDPGSAVRWLADDELPYATPSIPCDPAQHPQVVRIAVAAGDAGLARRALGVAEELERCNPDVPLLAGLAAQCRGLLRGDASELARAAELLAGCERPLVLASALEDAGRSLADVERLRCALERYEAAGASADAARVTARLRTLGVRGGAVTRRPAEGWESLTESELRVVRLVGRGATNRDAAESLYLSPHTVSSHLRHAFAKLRINSRVELARLLHEHDLPGLLST